MCGTPAERLERAAERTRSPPAAVGAASRGGKGRLSSPASPSVRDQPSTSHPVCNVKREQTACVCARGAINLHVIQCAVGSPNPLRAKQYSL
jgi:hypothetical protein